jgi:POT family proton-dependent oligopeptide transporter
MEIGAALSIYGWSTAAFLLSKVIGGIIGDLVLGNKKTVILGLALQAIGAWLFCITSTTCMYSGLFFLALGTGLFDTNMDSNFGKLYLRKPVLIDAGLPLII